MRRAEGSGAAASDGTRLKGLRTAEDCRKRDMKKGDRNVYGT